MAAGLATLVLFSVFLVVRVVLLATRRVTDCGCHGGFLSERLDAARVLTSLLLVMLACVQVYASWNSGDAIRMAWRSPFILGYGVVALWLARRILIRHGSGLSPGQRRKAAPLAIPR